MLDKDTIVTDIIMNCGCILTHQHFFLSGVQHDNARQHIKARYDYDINKEKIADFHDDLKRLAKLTDKVDVKRLCYWHTSELLSDIVHNTRNYFNKEQEKET